MEYYRDEVFPIRESSIAPNESQVSQQILDVDAVMSQGTEYVHVKDKHVIEEVAEGNGGHAHSNMVLGDEYVENPEENVGYADPSIAAINEYNKNPVDNEVRYDPTTAMAYEFDGNAVENAEQNDSTMETALERNEKGDECRNHDDESLVIADESKENIGDTEIPSVSPGEQDEAEDTGDQLNTENNNSYAQPVDVESSEERSSDYYGIQVEQNVQVIANQENVLDKSLDANEPPYQTDTTDIVESDHPNQSVEVCDPSLPKSLVAEESNYQTEAVEITQSSALFEEKDEPVEGDHAHDDTLNEAVGRDEPPVEKQASTEETDENHELSLENDAHQLNNTQLESEISSTGCEVNEGTIKTDLTSPKHEGDINVLNVADNIDDSDDAEEGHENTDEPADTLEISNPVLVVRNPQDSERSFRSAILDDWDPDGTPAAVVNGHVEGVHDIDGEGDGEERVDEIANKEGMGEVESVGRGIGEVEKDKGGIDVVESDKAEIGEAESEKGAINEEEGNKAGIVESDRGQTSEVESSTGQTGEEESGTGEICEEESGNNEIENDNGEIDEPENNVASSEKLAKKVKKEIIYPNTETPLTDAAMLESLALRASRLELSNFRISREDVVKEIINAEPKPVPPILTGRNLFLSIELAKHSRGEDTEESQREELLEILEGDQVGDWRQASLKIISQKENVNDVDIALELKNETANTPKVMKPRPPAPKRTPATPSTSVKRVTKKKTPMDREAERRLALEQLETEFAVKKRRPKPVDSPQNVAVADLKRALSSTPVLTGRRKRRPCYLPEVKKEEAATATPTAVKKTYAPKRRSLDTNSEVQTALETIAVVNKHVNSVNDEEISPVKKAKTVKTVKKVKKKPTEASKGPSKELLQLLGDEGAIRMLYDAAHDGVGDAKRPHSKTKKDLMQKTKFVQNAVIRLSEGEMSLRGNKKVHSSTEALAETDPLFPPAAPATAQSRPRKKPRPAEASKILYRHSSSESFDDSECLQKSTDGVVPDQSPDRSPNQLFSPVRKSSRPRKVSSRFSVWAAESLSAKKARKSDDSRLSAEFQALKSAVKQEVKVEPPEEIATPENVSDDAPVNPENEENVEMHVETIGGNEVNNVEPSSNNVEPVSNEEATPAGKSTRTKTDTSAALPKVTGSRASRTKVEVATKTATTPVPDRLRKSRKPVTPKEVTLSEEVTSSQSGSLVTINISSEGPSIKNGLTPEVLDVIRLSLDDATRNDTCKAVLLSSDGDVFCQGVDLSLLEPGFGDPNVLVESVRDFLTTLVTFEKPVIAAVQGPAFGLGVTILPLCDTVICSDRATFYTPYTKLCQGPEGAASVTFPRNGIALVSELLYKCSKLDASDALRLGLISQIVPHDSFTAELNSICECICAQPEQALISMKRLLTESGRQAILEGISRECEALLQAWNSPDCSKAAADFLASGELLPNS